MGKKWLQFLVAYEAAFKKDSTCQGVSPIIAPEVIANFKSVGANQLGESIADLALIDLTGNNKKIKNDQKAGIAETIGYGTTALAGSFGFSYAVGTSKIFTNPNANKYMRIAGITGATIATFAAVGLYIFAAKAGSEGTSEGNLRKAAVLNRVGYAMGTFLQLATVVTAVGVYKKSKLGKKNRISTGLEQSGK